MLSEVRKCSASSFAGLRAESPLGVMAIAVAGNCHRREKRTESCAPGIFVSKVRPRESTRTAAAMRTLADARFRRAAGNLSTRPSARALQWRAMGQAAQLGERGP